MRIRGFVSDGCHGGRGSASSASGTFSLRPSRLLLANPLASRASREIDRSAFALVRVVVRGGVEPPTFRFSGLRITVQDRPQRSACLLSRPRYTPMDAGVRGCTRLEMRLTARPV